MAKARYKNNKKKNKRLSKEQKTLIKRLSQFNVLTKNLIEKCTNLKENSEDFKTLIENKIIQKTEKFNYKSQEIYAYKLTRKGKTLAKNQGFTTYYSNSKKHDIAHATNVIENFKNQLDFYHSEKELNSIPGTSRVDGAIISPQGTILLETITPNYSREKIENKRAYAEKYSQHNEYIEYLEMKV